MAGPGVVPALLAAALLVGAAVAPCAAARLSGASVAAGGAEGGAPRFQDPIGEPSQDANITDDGASTDSSEVPGAGGQPASDSGQGQYYQRRWADSGSDDESVTDYQARFVERKRLAAQQVRDRSVYLKFEDYPVWREPEPQVDPDIVFYGSGGYYGGDGAVYFSAKTPTEPQGYYGANGVFYGPPPKEDVGGGGAAATQRYGQGGYGYDAGGYGEYSPGGYVAEGWGYDADGQGYYGEGGVAAPHGQSAEKSPRSGGFFDASPGGGGGGPVAKTRPFTPMERFGGLGDFAGAGPRGVRRGVNGEAFRSQVRLVCRKPDYEMTCELSTACQATHCEEFESGGGNIVLTPYHLDRHLRSAVVAWMSRESGNSRCRVSELLGDGPSCFSELFPFGHIR